MVIAIAAIRRTVSASSKAEARRLRHSTVRIFPATTAPQKPGQRPNCSVKTCACTQNSDSDLAHVLALNADAAGAAHARPIFSAVAGVHRRCRGAYAIVA